MHLSEWARVAFRRGGCRSGKGPKKTRLCGVRQMEAVRFGITYDRGLTFDYFLPATYYNESDSVLDENTFWMAGFDGRVVSVYHRK